jgi:hypothetical protein
MPGRIIRHVTRTELWLSFLPRNIPGARSGLGCVRDMSSMPLRPCARAVARLRASCRSRFCSGGLSRAQKLTQTTVAALLELTGFWSARYPLPLR